MWLGSPTTSVPASTLVGPVYVLLAFSMVMPLPISIHAAGTGDRAGESHRVGPVEGELVGNANRNVADDAAGGPADHCRSPQVPALIVVPPV